MAAPHDKQKPLTAAQVFDDVGPAYEDAFADLPEQGASIQWLLANLPQRSSSSFTPARCVDIGCGTGRPVCAALAAAGHDVLGIDISAAMVAAARERVPGARFEQTDVRDFEAPDGGAYYDAATVYFSMIAGVTPEDIKHNIRRIFGFLKPGGLFVYATVPMAARDAEVSWLGRRMVVSSIGVDDNLAAVRAAGFEIEHEAVTTFMPRAVEAGICAPDEVAEEPHLFVYARKPRAADAAAA